MSVRRRIGVALVLCAALGCHRVAQPPQPQGAIRSAAEALAVLEHREADTRTLTATFKLTLRKPDGSEESSRGAVVVARPDRLRLQIFSFGVMTAYDYTANGDRYRARRPLQGQQTSGRFGEAAADRADAFGEDLRPLFLGAPGLANAAVRDSGDRWIVVVPGGSERREIELSKRDGAVLRETLYAGDASRLSMDYGDYRGVDGVSMPFAITVTVPDKQLRLTIEVARYTRDQPVDPHLFEF